MYTLAIGDRTYSSWSLRGWLLFDAFNIPVTVTTARMYTDAFPKMLEAFAPARTVPALKIDGQDQAIWDSLSIAETLHERHPDAGMWPKDPALRALGRSLAAEMHSGFMALREDCTMNLEYAYSDFKASDAVRDDLERLQLIWGRAVELSGGPWLCGTYSIADVFFAPVATRVATYGLEVSTAAQTYVDAHLNHGPFRRWRAMGRAENYRQAAYQLPYTKTEWPGPTPLPAKAATSGSSVNATCPFSGKPVAHDSLAEIDGKIIGFCNPFCRDKSVADPDAWPQVKALLEHPPIKLRQL